jgi:ribonuclease HII
MDNLGGLLGTVLVAGVLLKTTDYLFKKQKAKDKKKLRAIWQ